MFSLLLKGLMVGLAIAVPVGPVGLMCLENTVTRGKQVGLCCASGMVLADIFSSGIMLVGFGIFYDTILVHEHIFKIVTGLIFMAVGISILMTRNQPVKKASAMALARLGIASFLLAVSPATFALLLFLFPALELTQNGFSAPVVLGVAMGSAAWCSLILGAGSFIRSCLGNKLARFKAVVGSIFALAGAFGVVTNLVLLVNS